MNYLKTHYIEICRKTLPFDDDKIEQYAEIKALCAGNPLIKEKMDLDIEVARLKLLKANHQSTKYRLEDNLLKHFPESIERHKGYISKALNRIL